MEPRNNKDEIVNIGIDIPNWNDKVVSQEPFKRVGSKFLSNASTTVAAAIPDSLPVANIVGTVAVSQGGTGAVTLTGILKGNGTSAVTAVTPLAGTKVYYVAPTSGVAATTKLTFTDGILTSET